MKRWLRIETLGVISAALLAGLSVARSPVAAQTKQAGKPNIVIIWGDDVGQSNISAYTRGLMGYQTPNIDRVANEGMIFTDCYAEQVRTPIGRHGRRHASEG